jgi:uncharacterized protein DUF3105
MGRSGSPTNPTSPKTKIERLSDLAQGNSYVLVSLYPNQDAPVVAIAWGIQQRLGSAEDPELEQYVGTYGQNPGFSGGGEHSSCTGG